MNSAVDTILERYKSTAEAKDIEGHLAIYDEDILIFDLWDEWSLRGKPALRKMVAEWFGSLGSERVKIDFEPTLSTAKKELAYVSAIVKYSAVSVDGETLRWLQSRMTLVLEYRNETWKIIHQHTSNPVAPNLQAKLQMTSP